MDYNIFLKEKQIIRKSDGILINKNELSNILFDYEKDLVRWALSKGKAALFTGTGTGKTLMELEFARIINEKKNENILIITPLAVSEQTIREADEKLNLNVNNARNNKIKKGINIINYEYIQKINLSYFGCVILDESSILKSYSGKIRNFIIDSFNKCNFKLAATATPAPNDYMELGNHCEFLDVMSRREMLSMFFTHDGGNTSKWRLKGHAKDRFWEFVSSWAVVMNKPSDFGYNDKLFDLPKLNIDIIKLETNIGFGDKLFKRAAKTLNERRKARRLTLDKKINWIKNKVQETNDIYLIWCDLNEESKKLKEAIKGSVEIKGSDDNIYKTKTMLDFSLGKIRVLITKPSIAGFGMNWQICHNQIFCGLSDSFERYYQAVRRSWRFGQKHNVNIYIVTADCEIASLDNIYRKEHDFEIMHEEIRRKTNKYSIKELKNINKYKNTYKVKNKIELPKWL